MGAAPSSIEHWLPPGTAAEPVQLSLVIPALDEALTVGEFVAWCREGTRRAGVTAQILIVDSSTDDTAQRALAQGAEVLRVPRRGLGRAYVDAIPFIRGEWVIMGDADLTYDFRELTPFVDKFRAGFEFVMGSRFKGSIESGAMPPLHRYFGTPLTTWVLNRLYGSHFSDIHCGMRGLTRAALIRLRLRSQAWEYASEMVLKAARLGLRIAEVPVRFYRDREGRESHHRRAGWLSPWRAGWQNLRVMLVYSPDSFVLKPGLALLATGFTLCAVLSTGPRQLGPIELNLHSMLLALTGAVLGYGCVQLGVLARLMHGLRPDSTRVWLALFRYNRGVLAGAVFGLAGLGLVARFIREYFAHGLHLVGFSHLAIFGLLLLIIGFQTFTFSLLLEIAQRTIDESCHR